MPEFHIIIVRKKYFVGNFWGTCPLLPISYAYGALPRLQWYNDTVSLNGRIWRIYLKARSSSYDFKIFITAVLTLNFDLLLSKVKRDDEHRMKIGLLSFR